MRAVITGGAGFVGSHLCERFLAEGHEVICLDNPLPGHRRNNDGRVLPAFMGQVLRGEPLAVFGKGDHTRSFCYVTDLVDGIYRLLLSDYALPVDIGNPAEITVLELAEEIIAMVPGTKSTIDYRDLPQDDSKRRKPDITKARTILGRNPVVDRADGLARTLAYFRNVL